MSSIPPHRLDRAVAAWLLVVCAMVFAMVVIGGITRLTNSGLSMVDWRPIMGVLPPLSQTEWEATFEAYKAYPEYQKINQGMDLDGFKEIFFWEWFHRVFGRLIGLAFFVPLVYFWARGAVQGVRKAQYTIALILGGLQGLLGWYMVKSGLVDRPDVSHYRLAAHLLLAIGVMGYLMWLALDLLRPRPAADARVPSGNVAAWGWALMGLLTLQILYGAFTAGLNAGYGFNTWPLMGDEFLATGAMMLQPGWLNFVENTTMLQFVHRRLGAAVRAGASFVWWRAWQQRDRAAGAQVRAAHALLAVTLGQFLLGVLTLVYAIPLSLASLHQAGACVLVLALTNLVHATSARGATEEASHESLSGSDQYDSRGLQR